jgi:hypothetical protein
LGEVVNDKLEREVSEVKNEIEGTTSIDQSVESLVYHEENFPDRFYSPRVFYEVKRTGYWAALCT